MQFKSRFCDLCKEERWTGCSKEYVENERGEHICHRCMKSVRSLQRPLFSTTNNMVGTHTHLNITYQMVYIHSHTCTQIPRVLPPELRNCTPLEYRITSPAAVIMQIYCVRGTGRCMLLPTPPHPTHPMNILQTHPSPLFSTPPPAPSLNHHHQQHTIKAFNH